MAGGPYLLGMPAGGRPLQASCPQTTIGEEVQS
jgi:hypothetical protein